MIPLEKRVSAGAKSLLSGASLIMLLGSVSFAMMQARAATRTERKDAGSASRLAAGFAAKPIEDLQWAAQSLRDAIHEMVWEQPDPKRDEWIHKADKTLTEVDAAMLNLPRALQTERATGNHYRAASDEVAKAARDLEEATRALAKAPNSERRNDAMRIIKTALSETHRLINEIARNQKGK